MRQYERDTTLGVLAARAVTLTRREHVGNEGILPSIPGWSIAAWCRVTRVHFLARQSGASTLRQTHKNE